MQRRNIAISAASDGAHSREAVVKGVQPTANASCEVAEKKRQRCASATAGGAPSRRHSGAISSRQRGPSGSAEGSAGRLRVCPEPFADTDYDVRSLPQQQGGRAWHAIALPTPCEALRRAPPEQPLRCRSLARALTSQGCAAMRELHMGRGAASRESSAPHIVQAAVECARRLGRSSRRGAGTHGICYIRATAGARKRAIACRCQAPP
jgi:hypothetical protein